MTTPQVAARLGKTEAWVRRLILSGRLTAVKEGRDWRITEESVEAWAAQIHKAGRPKLRQR